MVSSFPLRVASIFLILVCGAIGFSYFGHEFFDRSRDNGDREIIMPISGTTELAADRFNKIQEPPEAGASGESGRKQLTVGENRHEPSSVLIAGDQRSAFGTFDTGLFSVGSDEGEGSGTYQRSFSDLSGSEESGEGGPSERTDKADEAVRYYLKKRLPSGEKELPTERYFDALERIKSMPQYSTTENRVMPPKAERPAGSIDSPDLFTWNNLGPGNVGGRTRALVIDPTDPNVMFAAGVAGGIWKTTNGGTTWAPLDDFLANLAVTCLAMDPANSQILYAGTGEGYFNGDSVRGAGIFQTTNGGMTWTRLMATTTSDYYYVNDLVVSPANPAHLYAATQTGIFRSLDSGAGWTLVLSSSVANGANGAMDLVMRTDQSTDYIFASIGTFAQSHIWRNTDAGGAGYVDRCIYRVRNGTNIACLNAV